MRRMDIATRIHQQAGIPMEEAARILDWILEFFKTTLQAGEPISIPGFGKFTVRNKRARPGRNPITGEVLTVSARRVATFHASHLLKAHINSLTAEVPKMERNHIDAAEGEVSSTISQGKR